VDGYMIIDGSTSDYKIIEEGGEKLPTDRSYSNIGTPIKITTEDVVKEMKDGGEIDDLHFDDIITIPDMKFQIKGLSKCKNYALCEVLGVNNYSIIQIDIDKIFKNGQIISRNEN